MATVKENSKIHTGIPLSVAKDTLDLDCYIINTSLNPGESGRTIPLMFSPNSLSDSVSASYNQQQLPGGSAPVITYSGTGARQLSMDFFVPIDYLPPSSEYKNTEQYLNALRALLYPKYSGVSVKPPTCEVYLTNTMLLGVCTQCSISYKTDQRYGNDGALGADVSLTFLEVVDSLWSNEQIFNKDIHLGANNIGVYEERPITNAGGGSGRGSDSSIDDQFRLRGNSVAYSSYKRVRSNPNQYAPSYVDEGYTTNNNGTIVKFYYVSPSPISFTGNDIKGENPNGKSTTFKICIDGESYSKSNKVLSRNQLPEYTESTIREMSISGDNRLYYYYIYARYLNLDKYQFNKALIRCVVCEGSLA